VDRFDQAGLAIPRCDPFGPWPSGEPLFDEGDAIEGRDSRRLERSIESIPLGCELFLPNFRGWLGGGWIVWIGSRERGCGKSKRGCEDGPGRRDLIPREALSLSSADGRLFS
jgi:hypothetical protein